MSRPGFSPEGSALGACLIAVGVVWMLANAGRLELLPTLRTWWPLSLVLWGLLELVAFVTTRSSRRS